MIIKQKSPTTASGGGSGFIKARAAETSQADTTGGPQPRGRVVNRKSS